jgi:hypothetical protein
MILTNVNLNFGIPLGEVLELALFHLITILAYD